MLPKHLTKKSLTVVTISFRDIPGLRATLSSIKAQTNQDFDWIVIDGGTSEFADIKDELAERANILISEKDNGIYDAMMKGAKLTSTSHVMFLNSGDTFHSNKSTEIAASNLPPKGVLYFGAQFLSADGRTKSLRMARNPDLYIYHSVPGNQQATIYKTEDVLKFGFGGGKFRICGDYFLACSLFKSHAPHITSDIVLSNFSIGGVSSTSPDILRTEAEEIQKTVLGMPWFARKISATLRRISYIRASIILMNKQTQQ